MATRFLIFCLSFLFAGLSGISLTPSLAGAESYSARACAKVYQRVRFVQTNTRSAQAGMSIMRRKLDNVKRRLNAIQAQRRRIGCTNTSRLDRSEIRTCSRLTKKRMSLLREKASINKEFSKRIRRYNAAVREEVYIEKINSRCKDARRKRSRRITERQGNKPQMRHSRANSAASIAVIRGIGAAMQRRTIRRSPRRPTAKPGKCHRNPRTGAIDCGSY